MNRATLVYILMLIGCGGGLWGILRAGAPLRAPLDLAGTWDVLPGGTGGDLGPTMTVEQSGRYVVVRFAAGPALELEVERQQRPAAPGGPSMVQLAGDGTTLKAILSDGGRTMAGEMTGPRAAAFTARLRTDTRPGARGGKH
jgi:hypothetical protein